MIETLLRPIETRRTRSNITEIKEELSRRVTAILQKHPDFIPSQDEIHVLGGILALNKTYEQIADELYLQKDQVKKIGRKALLRLIEGLAPEEATTIRGLYGRVNMSQAHKGQPSPFKGHRHTSETRELISELAKKRLKPKPRQ